MTPTRAELIEAMQRIARGVDNPEIVAGNVLSGVTRRTMADLTGELAAAACWVTHADVNAAELYVAYIEAVDGTQLALARGPDPDTAVQLAKNAIDDGHIDPSAWKRLHGGDVSGRIRTARADWHGPVMCPQVIVVDDRRATLTGDPDLWRLLWDDLPGLAWRVERGDRAWCATGFHAGCPAMVVRRRYGHGWDVAIVASPVEVQSTGRVWEPIGDVVRGDGVELSAPGWTFDEAVGGIIIRAQHALDAAAQIAAFRARRKGPGSALRHPPGEGDGMSKTVPRTR